MTAWHREVNGLKARKAIIYKQIGAKIAYYRKMRELTQEELAEKIHLSRSSIGRIERGKYNHNISISLLIDIADGLRIDIAMLVTFDEQEKKIWWSLQDGEVAGGYSG